jgi:hypothetical protein
MVFAREFPVGLADLVHGGLAFHPEGFVVLVLGSGHKKKAFSLQPSAFS